MSTSHTLPTGPLEHLALDYARLREEGIRLLGRLAGAQWTDFNAHDPGITILEQLCYAITALAYRIEHPIADLLAGSELAGTLPGPANVMSCDPVTEADLRKVVLDVDGVGNAWIEPQGAPEVALFYHHGSKELRFEADPEVPEALPVQLSGLSHFRVPTSGATLTTVAERLHACRGLGEDFRVTSLGVHEVIVSADIEVGPMEDPVGVMADIIEQIEACLVPSVRFTTGSDARADGFRSEQLFEGPTLDHGFVLEELPQVPRTVRVSDLIHAIMDVPAVRAVSSIRVEGERWVFTIPADCTATLDIGSRLQLRRAGLTVQVTPEAGKDRLGERRRAALARVSADTGVALAPGRDRHLGKYQPLRHHLPAAYGVGPLGLPASAPVHRHAQALQLRAYLLFFDQLLANAFAQLARARELLSPESERETYFTQAVEEAEPMVTSLDPPPVSPERRKRFLTHLLARFGEQLGDHTQLDGDLPSDTRDGDVIADRRTFLLEFPQLSRSRGSGYDLVGATSELSGLERRLRLKLGLRDRPSVAGVPRPPAPRFHLVEHILLRPIPEDAGPLGVEGEPRVPLLAGVSHPDPWSLQISLVFEASEGGKPGDAFEQMVARTIVAEIPSHLRSYLRWIDSESDWSVFEDAWNAFKTAYRAYRRAKLDKEEVADEVHIRLRDTRDRVIDLLGFAQTYPLRDLPVPEFVIVAPGKSATISIGLSQLGVVYRLYDRNTGDALIFNGKAVEGAGTGGTIELVTPAIDVDITCRIRAVKGSREAWLHGLVKVAEGVDPAVVAQIRLPLLDETILAPRPMDARIADYGAEVEVEVLASQEGVEYELRDEADHDKVLSKTVVGTSGTIVLRTEKVFEDLSLRVQGTKVVSEPKRVGLLTLVLPLRVRANPSVAATLVPGAAIEHGAGATLKLAATQQSAEYQVWRRRVRDSEFVFADPSPAPTIGVVDKDGHVIRVERPEKSLIWQNIAGFVPEGEPRPGTGSGVEFPVTGVVEDSVLLVEARKRHRMGPVGSELESQLRSGGLSDQLRSGGLLEGLEVDVYFIDDEGETPVVSRVGEPGVRLRVPEDPPRLACRPEELERLRTDPAAATVLKSVRDRARAVCLGKDRVTTADLPPLGGQHESRYRCLDCDVKLTEPERPAKYPYTPPDETLSHACPKCHKIYRGYPFDSYVYGVRHAAILDQMFQCALAYKSISLVGDQTDVRSAEQEKKRFATLAVSTLLAYADKMREWPLLTVRCRCAAPRVGVPHGPWCGELFRGGQIHAQTLDEARLVVRAIAPTYDLLRGYLTGDERKRVKADLFDPILDRLVAFPIREDLWISNWHTWHAAALITAGVALDDKGRIDVGRAAIEHQLDPDNHALSAEGFWHEGSWGYHLFTLDALVRAAEAGRCSGAFDLWKDERFRAMCLVPFQFRMPDDTCPLFGDTKWTTLKDTVKPFVEPIFYALPSQLLAPMLPDDPGLYTALRGPWPAWNPAGEKRDFPVDGYTVLATNGPGALRAVVTYGPFSASHGHFDKLGFVLFGFEKELGVDPGREASQDYNAPIHLGWYKTSLSHNTVVIDGALQAPVRGDRLMYGVSDDGKFAAVSMRVMDIYPGVDQTRVLVLGPDYLIVIDEVLVKDNKSRTIDWLYHNRGAKAAVDALLVASGNPPQFTREDPPPARLLAALSETERASEVNCYANGGGQFIVADATQEPSLTDARDRGVRSRFHSESGWPTTYLTLAGELGTSVLLGDGPHGLEVNGKKIRVPFIRARRTSSTRARFVAVIEPVQGDALPRIEGVQVSESSDAGLTAQVGDGTIAVQFTGGSVTVNVSGISKLELK